MGKNDDDQKSSSTLESSFISFSLSKEELATLTNLLGVTAKTFESLALQAAQQNDEETYQIFSARHKLSNHFVSKLVDIFKMPEPISRDIH
jgi:hypothetical protein